MKQTVYIASPESQQIHVWNLNHEGALTLTQVVDVPGQVQPMVVSPDKRYLYVGVRPEFRVLAYRIAPDDGALTFAAESALPGSPTHISTDHQGQFVFVGSYNAGNVSVTRLEAGLVLRSASSFDVIRTGGGGTGDFGASWPGNASCALFFDYWYPIGGTRYTSNIGNNSP